MIFWLILGHFTQFFELFSNDSKLPQLFPPPNNTHPTDNGILPFSNDQFQQVPVYLQVNFCRKLLPHGDYPVGYDIMQKYHTILRKEDGIHRNIQ